ncbi:hypothetical protein JCM3765_000682 [Sporobolomyces pararoseus]
MSAFPAIGTVYPSVAAFKLDILQRGDLYGVNLISKSQRTTNKAQFQCGVLINGRRTCSCTVGATETNGIWRVNNSNSAHTCDEQARISKLENVKVSRQQKLEMAKREVEMEQRWNEIGAADIEEDISGRRLAKRAKKSTYSQEGGTATKRKRERSQSETDSTGEEDSEESDDDRASESRHVQRSFRRLARNTKVPEPEKVQAKIYELSETYTKLELPPYPQGFAQLQDLFAHWILFAHQQGFELRLRRSIADSKNVRLVCGWETKTPVRRQCLFSVQAQQASDGCWYSVPTSSLGHIHPLSPKIVPHALPPPLSASGSSPFNSLASTSNSPTPQSLSSRALMAPSIHSPCPLYKTFPSSGQAYPQDLINFLRSFDSSPSTLSQTLEALHRAGADSLEALVSVLLMEERFFSRFISSVRGGGGEKLAEIRSELKNEVARGSEGSETSYRGSEISEK